MGEFVEYLCPSHLDIVFRFLLRGQPIGLDHVVPENGDGRRHRADFVVTGSTRDFTGNVAAGEARHGRGQFDDRLADAAANHKDHADAGTRHSDQARERDQEAEMRRK